MTPVVGHIDPHESVSEGVLSADPAFRERTRLEALLPKVLMQMGWRRSDAVYDSALSSRRGIKQLDEAAMLLALLEFPARVSRDVPREWKDGLDGAIVVHSGGHAHAIVRVNGNETTLSTDASADDELIKRTVRRSREFLFLRKVGAEGSNVVLRQQLMERIRGGLRHGLFISFFVNVFAVTIPIFTMTIFDRVIGANAPNSLWPLITGALIVVLAVTYMRRARARFLAARHARLAAIAGSEMEIRLLRGGFHALQRQSIEQIDARIANVRRISDLFASSSTAAVFDAPFILLSILVIGFIGGILAVVPAVYLLFFVLVAIAVSQSPSRTDPELTNAAQDRTALLHELGTKATELRESLVASAWLHRFAEVCKLTALGANKAGTRQAAVQSIGSILGTGTALVTLIVGVDLAITGVITPGTLVATMLLTWRITGPAQAFFLGLPRLRLAWRSLGALDRSLSAPTVTTPAVALEPMPRRAPAVEAAGLFFRYEAENEPALTGVSFTLEPGSITAVIGPNGAGKTTLLRVLGGILLPQSGNVRLNGVTLRQFDPDELTASTLILPTLAERWANRDKPLAAVADAVWDPQHSLDRAMAGAMGDACASVEMSRNSSEAGPVYMLLDDPTARADPSERAAFHDFVSRHKGTATIVFSTHDTSLLSLADTAIVLNNGSLVYAGPVQQKQEPVKGTLEING